MTEAAATELAPEPAPTTDVLLMQAIDELRACRAALGADIAERGQLAELMVGWHRLAELQDELRQAAMFRALSKIEADHRNVPKAQKVRQDKPADATDQYFAADQQLPASACPVVYPSYSTPRIEAGEPLRNDNVKCQLKPLKRSDYKVTFTDAEWAQLKQAFPTGVCDWSKPAVQQQRAATWLTFAYGSQGTPLGAPPESVPFGSH